MTNEQKLQSLLESLSGLLTERGLLLVTAESCTGGWIAKVCTDRAGSSKWFEAGLLAYSDMAKELLLGVSRDALDKWGAVSDVVVKQMAEGALNQLPNADVAIAVTGIAGPTGGFDDKSVGLVWIGWALRDKLTITQSFHFEGGRAEIRYQSVITALGGLIKQLVV